MSAEFFQKAVVFREELVQFKEETGNAVETLKRLNLADEWALQTIEHLKAILSDTNGSLTSLDALLTAVGRAPEATPEEPAEPARPGTGRNLAGRYTMTQWARTLIDSHEKIKQSELRLHLERGGFDTGSPPSKLWQNLRFLCVGKNPKYKVKGNGEDRVYISLTKGKPTPKAKKKAVKKKKARKKKKAAKKKAKTPAKPGKVDNNPKKKPKSKLARARMHCDACGHSWDERIDPDRSPQCVKCASGSVEVLQFYDVEK